MGCYLWSGLARLMSGSLQRGLQWVAGGLSLGMESDLSPWSLTGQGIWEQQ